MTTMPSQTNVEQVTSNPIESKNSSESTSSPGSANNPISQPSGRPLSSKLTSQATSSTIDHPANENSSNANAHPFGNRCSVPASGLPPSTAKQLTSSTGSAANLSSDNPSSDRSNANRLAFGSLSKGNNFTGDSFTGGFTGGFTGDSNSAGDNFTSGSSSTGNLPDGSLTSDLSNSNLASQPSNPPTETSINSSTNSATNSAINSVTNSFEKKSDPSTDQDRSMIADHHLSVTTTDHQPNESPNAPTSSLGISMANMTKRPSDLLDAACQAIHSDLEEGSFGENFCIEIAPSETTTTTANHHCDLSEIVNNHILNDDLLLDDLDDGHESRIMSDCDLSMLLSVNEQTGSKYGPSTDNRTAAKFNLVGTLNGSLDSSLGDLSGGSNGGQMLNSELSSSQLFNSAGDSSYGVSHSASLTGAPQGASPYGASSSLASSGRSSIAPSNALSVLPTGGSLLSGEEHFASHLSNSLKKGRTSNVHLSYLLQTKPQDLPSSQLQKQLHARKLLTTDGNPFG